MRVIPKLGRVTKEAWPALGVLLVAPWAGPPSGVGSASGQAGPMELAAVVCSADRAATGTLRCLASMAGARAPARGAWLCRAHRPICLHGGFTVGGNTWRPLYPGTSEALDLSITNPFKFAIKVFGVSVRVEPVPTKDGRPDPACPGTANLLVTRPLRTTVTVPPRSTKLLSDLDVPQRDWPQLTMPDLPVNQDACEGAVFTLDYRASATPCDAGPPRSRWPGPAVG